MWYNSITEGKREVFKMKEKFWENIGYFGLGLCLFGNITVGYFYLVAQFVYLLANGINLIRNFALNRPMADKVRDLAFFVITIALIILKIF